jgi:hypothetical protein
MCICDGCLRGACPLDGMAKTVKIRSRHRETRKFVLCNFCCEYFHSVPKQQANVMVKQLLQFELTYARWTFYGGNIAYKNMLPQTNFVNNGRLLSNINN